MGARTTISNFQVQNSFVDKPHKTLSALAMDFKDKFYRNPDLKNALSQLASLTAASRSTVEEQKYAD